MTTITSANAVLTLTAAGVFPAPVQIQGFEVDKAWMADNVDVLEEKIGVDGTMTAGYIFNGIPMTITLMADSPSNTFFAAVAQFMKTQREVVVLTGTLALASTGENFVMTKGYLKTPNQLPEGARTLGARENKLVWQTIDRTLL